METMKPVRDKPEEMRPLYVSQIKLFGFPIIAPFMNEKKRAEMRILREKAIEVERRLEKKHSLCANLREATDSLAASETPVALPRNESASNEATISSRASEVESVWPKIPQIEILSPSVSESTRSIADSNPNQVQNHPETSDMQDASDFAKIYLSFPPLDTAENTIESQLCFQDLNSSGSIDLNLDLTASSICSPHRPHDLSLLEGIRAPNVSLLSTPDALASRDFKRCFREFLEQKLGQLETADARTDSVTDFTEPRPDGLDVPALVRQNSYTLLEGPSPLIIAHLEQRQSARDPTKPRPRSASQGSTNRGSPSKYAANRKSPTKTAANRSPTSTSTVADRSSVSSHVSRSPLRRRGWDLDRARQFWSSAEALDRMFALPRPRPATAAKTAKHKVVVNGNRSLPGSAAPSPVKSLRRHTAFGSLDGLTTPTPTKQPTRRSLFKPAVTDDKAENTKRQTSSKPSGDWSRESERKRKQPAQSTSQSSRGSPRIALNLAKPSTDSRQTRASQEVIESSHASRNVSKEFTRVKVSESGHKMSENVRELSESGRGVSESGRDMSESGRGVSESGCDMSESGRGVSESGHKLSEKGRGVDALVLRLQRDHQRQMSALLERQRADQRRMQLEFAEQERKLLAAIQAPVATATEGSTDTDDSPTPTQAESPRDEDHIDAPATPPPTDISIRLAESVTSPLPLVETLPSPLRLVESMPNPLRLVESMPNPLRLVESMPSPLRLAESPVRRIETQYERVSTKMSASIDGNPVDWLAFQNAGTPRSQRALSAMRNIHNAREELAWEKENVCDSYSGSEQSSLTTRSVSRSHADHAFRPLHQNGQTGNGTGANVLSDRSWEGTANGSSDGSEASCNSWHLRLNTPAPPPPPPSTKASDREQRAASVICAGARGFLVRRLLRTAHVRDIRRTIQDVTFAALELHRENQDTVNEEDVELGRRLIHQLNASWLALYETFFVLSTRERLAIIAADRARIGHGTRPRTSGSRLSSATQRSLRRKQASSSSPEESGRVSLATSHSVSRPTSAVSTTSRHSGKTTPRDLNPSSARNPKPWR